MQSSFRIVLQDNGCLLAMARELVEPQLADLKKYAVFSKSKLTDDSANWVRFGLVNADSVLQSLGLDLPAETDSVARASDLIAIRASEGRAELWAPVEQTESLVQHLKAQLPEADLNQWLLGQVRAGIGQVMAQTRELFIPQMINLQAVGGVSFKKGCYTGRKSLPACNTWANSNATSTACPLRRGMLRPPPARRCLPRPTQFRGRSGTGR
ncbi:tRNA-modifying protein YgfZ [Pseudomonas fragi]|uniref:tRNA-modifying protein YgfZ n=1 Tax=Pseudomonas fragi TaxID=296 RepID=A0A449IG76_PSEFR|nr:tRNA-modifying protein YgfZ [Pseudomonas fragi]